MLNKPNVSIIILIFLLYGCNNHNEVSESSSTRTATDGPQQLNIIENEKDIENDDRKECHGYLTDSRIIFLRRYRDKYGSINKIPPEEFDNEELQKTVFCWKQKELENNIRYRTEEKTKYLSNEEFRKKWQEKLGTVECTPRMTKIGASWIQTGVDCRNIPLTQQNTTKP